MQQIAATFEFLYPPMGKNGVYPVEDLHTAYWPKFGGGLTEPASFINIARGLADQLNADHAQGHLKPDAFTRETFSIAFYDSVVVFEERQIPRTGGIEIAGGKPTGRR